MATATIYQPIIGVRTARGCRRLSVTIRRYLPRRGYSIRKNLGRVMEIFNGLTVSVPYHRAGHTRTRPCAVRATRAFLSGKIARTIIEDQRDAAELRKLRGHG